MRGRMRPFGRLSAVVGAATIAWGAGCGAPPQTATAGDTPARVDWTQSYGAGYTDVYDAAKPTRIRWDEKVEFPARGTFTTRPLGIVEANGSLLFSVGGVVYRRPEGRKEGSQRGSVTLC